MSKPTEPSVPRLGVVIRFSKIWIWSSNVGFSLENQEGIFTSSRCTHKHICHISVCCGGLHSRNLILWLTPSISSFKMLEQVFIRRCLVTFVVFIFLICWKMTRPRWYSPALAVHTSAAYLPYQHSLRRYFHSLAQSDSQIHLINIIKNGRSSVHQKVRGDNFRRFYIWFGVELQELRGSVLWAQREVRNYHIEIRISYFLVTSTFFSGKIVSLPSKEVMSDTEITSFCRDMTAAFEMEEETIPQDSLSPLGTNTININIFMIEIFYFPFRPSLHRAKTSRRNHRLLRHGWEMGRSRY